MKCRPNIKMFKLQIIQRFAVVDLSNFYFDIAKDRLYVGYVNYPNSFEEILCELFHDDQKDMGNLAGVKRALQGKAVKQCLQPIFYV